LLISGILSNFALACRKSAALLSLLLLTAIGYAQKLKDGEFVESVSCRLMEIFAHVPYVFLWRRDWVDEHDAGKMNDRAMRKLLELYRKWSGTDPVSTEQLPGAGSNRVYYRFTAADGSTVVGCIGTSRDENHAFVYLARHFSKRRLPVPQVLAVSEDELRYLQTDLGDLSLFAAIHGGREAGGRYTLAEQELLKRTIRELPNVQLRGARELDFSNCYPQPQFDVDSVLFDLNYFKYCFLKATEVDFHELKLEADFRLLSKELTSEQCDAFLYRDFQARNIMLKDGQPYFIDFQGGRRGPFYYDLASFLWQASAKYPHKLRRELVYEYYNALKHYTEVPSSHHFAGRLSLFVLFRILQVLGAYGFRGYFERKQHFIASIPPAIQNLRELLDTYTFPYPHLMDVLHRLCELPRFAQVETTASRADGYKTTERNPYKAHPQDGPATFSKYDAQGPLVVKVFSFSYRKGIPEDESGNGGGYVFDCRSTHNPGRYEPYKKLTGLDEPVIRFLEDDGEILTFLDSVYKLADAHVRRYIQRGFTSLMFSFGCTGGQHRSVYSAQHLAEHLNKKFGVEVRVCHREQGIMETLPRA
jgi:aminoglycoside/choline kinase family phosphotransferase